MAAPRPKKKPPVKKAPPKKKPSFLRKDTPRPARDPKPGDMRSQVSEGPKKTKTLLDLENENKEARRRNKITKFRIQSLTSKADDLKKSIAKYENTRSKVKTPKTTASARSKALALLKGVAKGSGILGVITSPITSAVPAGEGSTKDKYSTLKKKYSSAIGPKQPAGTKKSSGFGKRISEGAKFERLRATRAALAVKSSDSGSLRKAGAGTYTASYDVKTQKSGPSNTAATTAAASGSNSGGSQAANVAKAGGKAKAKVGRQTRYQRNETAMEQRKSSSGKPKKSIFSLFRKG